MGPEQAELLISHGANPNKIAIGHMCGNMDIDYQERVIRILVEKGYGDKILLGHGAVGVNLGRELIMTNGDFWLGFYCGG